MMMALILPSQVPCTGRQAAPRHRIGHVLRAATTSRPRSSTPDYQNGPSGVTKETDVVVIGSGIGGLSCAAILAKYGFKVTVCESHDIPGGAAHAWVQDGFHFESGPSLYSGMSSRGRAANPMAHVLQMIGEELDLIQYDNWNVLLPEGTFLTQVGNTQFEEVLQQVSPASIPQWRALQDKVRPLAKAATMVPSVAVRADGWAGLTALARNLPSLIQCAVAGQHIGGLQLLGPFSSVLEGTVSDPFIKNWMDLLCFLLSGLPANGTITAEVAFMFNEWYKSEGCHLDFPRGGSQAIINALVRGLKKHGGQIQLKAHVAQIETTDGRATGVRLANGQRIKARKAVVSNASLWDTLPLLPPADRPAQMVQNADEIPLNRSFMHLHVGFDASGLEGLHMHHIVVNTWEHGVDSEQNVVLISIASVEDPSLAPHGKHTLHAYLPATEPFHLWEGLERGSPEYDRLKQERGEVLWKAVERIIPDIRERAEISMVGTPLTHKHFLRRHKGSYGPGIIAGKGTFPGSTTQLKGLYHVGDSTFPGIGVPAVAASGAIAANTLASPWQHWQLLDEIGV